MSEQLKIEGKGSLLWIAGHSVRGIQPRQASLHGHTQHAACELTVTDAQGTSTDADQRELPTAQHDVQDVSLRRVHSRAGANKHAGQITCMSMSGVHLRPEAHLKPAGRSVWPLDAARIASSPHIGHRCAHLSAVLHHDFQSLCLHTKLVA